MIKKLVWENDYWELHLVAIKMYQDHYKIMDYFDIDIYSKRQERFIAIYTNDEKLTTYLYERPLETTLPKYLMEKIKHYFRIRKILP
jgi:hypothetical protein